MLSYTGKGFEFSVWMTSNLSKGFSSTRANRESIYFLNTRKHCEQASLKVKLLADQFKGNPQPRRPQILKCLLHY